MKNQIQQLNKFQKSFKGLHNDKPTTLSKDEWELRYKLSLEELLEYEEACKNKDLVEIADAITDRLFLVLGDAVAHGLGDILPELFEEVVASNMSKLDENSNPIINGENGVMDSTKPLGKILKSPNYYKPDLKNLIEKYYGKDYISTGQ